MKHTIVASLALLAGCDQLSEPPWDVVLDPAIEADVASVHTIIRERGCSTDPFDVVYEQQILPRPATLEETPVLDEGDYCFEAIAQDAACRTIGEDALLVTLPLAADERIVNHVRPLATPRPCDGTCTPDGCL
jgi:hypothetical protein